MKEDNRLLTFDEHLKILNNLLLRILGVAVCFTLAIFYFKEVTFQVILAPSEYDFVTYRLIEDFISLLGGNFKFESFQVDLIATELSSQFMVHISTSIYLGLLAASPYILYKFFIFVVPALYESEKKYAFRLMIIVYLLFILGVLMNYYILFPISFRFLGTYSISDKVHNAITITSYISTFTTLTLIMGLVFQLPVLTFILGKLGFINSTMMSAYRKHALIIIMLIAAIITPPDIMTLIIVTLPLYLLYEISIKILKLVEI